MTREYYVRKNDILRKKLSDIRGFARGVIQIGEPVRQDHLKVIIDIVNEVEALDKKELKNE